MITISRLSRLTRWPDTHELVWHRGQYPSTKMFTTENVVNDDYGDLVRDGEQLRPQTIGTTIDFMTRWFVTKQPFEQLIATPEFGYKHGIESLTYIEEMNKKYTDDYLHKHNFKRSDIVPDNNFQVSAKRLTDIWNETCKVIKSNQDMGALTSKQIMAFVALSKFEDSYRGGYGAFGDINFAKKIDPVSEKHLQIMLNRSKDLFDKIGYPTVIDFAINGADIKTNIYGDGDYLSPDYVLDYKCYTKDRLDRSIISQLQLYYCLGKRIKKYDEFKTVHQLMIFNPRYGNLHTLNLKGITSQCYKDVNEVIKAGKQQYKIEQKRRRELEKQRRKLFGDLKIKDHNTAVKI